MRHPLDTDIISDHYKGVSPALDEWVDAQIEGDLAISPITVLKLDRGIRQRERRDPAQGVRLRLWLDEAVRPLFAGRILAVDERVALAASGLHSADRMPDMDTLIAATALVHGLTLVTRNTRDMERTGAALLNPWELAG